MSWHFGWCNRKFNKFSVLLLMVQKSGVHHLGYYKNLVNNGINYRHLPTSTGDFRICEPSTVALVWAWSSSIKFSAVSWGKVWCSLLRFHANILWSHVSGQGYGKPHWKSQFIFGHLIHLQGLQVAAPFIWHNWLHFLPKKHESHLGLAEKDDWTKVPKHILTNGDLIVIWLVASTHLKHISKSSPNRGENGKKH